MKSTSQSRRSSAPPPQAGRSAPRTKSSLSGVVSVDSFGGGNSSATDSTIRDSVTSGPISEKVRKQRARAKFREALEQLEAVCSDYLNGPHAESFLDMCSKFQ